MKIVLDTNVLVSAVILRNGKPFQLLKNGELGKVRIVLSRQIIEEFRKVLAEPRIGFTKREINTTIQKISSFSQIVNPKIKLKVVKEDLDDNKILECAIAGGAKYIVSGDKHILNLGRYKGIKIVSVAEMLEKL
ncbi:MAG: putative toxin-antitoxin system toxin component, PIN family [Euryarchaeota archaeon]|nr:putative toxin-antitoxin system toxin component, PIN family [Euryarchaeota archaeon]